MQRRVGVKRPAKGWGTRRPKVRKAPIRHLSTVDPQNAVVPLTRELREATIQALDLVGLKDHANKIRFELSGEIKQRCQFGRALVVEPRMLPMYERFAAIEVISKRAMNRSRWPGKSPPQRKQA